MKSATTASIATPPPEIMIAGLARGAEVACHAARAHLLLERERRVLLAAGAVGADGQEALAGALHAGRRWRSAGSDGARRRGAAAAPGRLGDRGHVAQALMQAGGDVHAGLDAPGRSGRPSAAASKPPELATPTIMVLAARRRRLGDAHVLACRDRPCSPAGGAGRSSARGRQSLTPCAVLAASWSATSPRKRRKGGSMGPQRRNGMAAMVGDRVPLPQCRLPGRVSRAGSADRHSRRRCPPPRVRPSRAGRRGRGRGARRPGCGRS